MSRPTEVQCLAQRACELPLELQATIEQLPFLCHQAQGSGDEATIGLPLALAHDSLLIAARTLQFDAERLALLLDDQADADRQLYALTVEAVDACRMARATALEEPGPDPQVQVRALANAVELLMADMQELLAARFPGEASLGA